MAESSTSTPAATEGTPTPTPAPPDPESTLGEGGKKALEEERKAKKAAEKERDALMARLKEIEDKDKTELQRLIERVETAERERDALRLDTMRANVALLKGLPPTLAERLRGNTVEEMSADADQLLSLVPPPPAANSRPAGDAGQGVRTSAALNGDPLLQSLKSTLGIP